jgi:hypothetical protein
MAIHAELAGGDNVRLIITQGDVMIIVVEEHEDLRRFWHDLGNALNLANEAEAEAG